MKILLVSPATGVWRKVGRRKIFNGKTFRFSMLSLLTVAKLSPPDADITIVDEQVEDIPFDEQFDVVGITAMTATAMADASERLSPNSGPAAANISSGAVPRAIG